MGAIKAKEKPCKGRGKAKGHGCGKVGIYNSMHLGLCTSCYPDWLLNTDEGKERIAKMTIKGKTEVAKVRRKETAQERVKIMSSNAYRAKKLQPKINEIARLIDYGQPCIATGVYDGKMNGGHFTSVGANRLIALNLHNIHIQSYQSNGPQGGQPIEYLEGLKREYGLMYSNYVLRLRQFRRMQRISKQEMVEAYPRALRVRNFLKKRQEIRTPEQRIRLRNLANKYIGLYPSLPSADWQKNKNK